MTEIRKTALHRTKQPIRAKIYIRNIHMSGELLPRWHLNISSSSRLLPLAPWLRSGGISRCPRTPCRRPCHWKWFIYSHILTEFSLINLNDNHMLRGFCHLSKMPPPMNVELREEPMAKGEAKKEVTDAFRLCRRKASWKWTTLIRIRQEFN